MKSLRLHTDGVYVSVVVLFLVINHFAMALNKSLGLLLASSLGWKDMLI